MLQVLVCQAKSTMARTTQSARLLGTAASMQISSWHGIEVPVLPIERYAFTA